MSSRPERVRRSAQVDSEHLLAGAKRATNEFFAYKGVSREMTRQGLQDLRDEIDNMIVCLDEDDSNEAAERT